MASGQRKPALWKRIAVGLAEHAALAWLGIVHLSALTLVLVMIENGNVLDGLGRDWPQDSGALLGIACMIPVGVLSSLVARGLKARFLTLKAERNA